MIQPDDIVSTTCPYCGVGCNLELHIKDETIYRVTSPFDAEVNQGNLCVKGRFGYDFIYHNRRVTTPLVRAPRLSIYLNGSRYPGMRRLTMSPVAWLKFTGAMGQMQWQPICVQRRATRTIIFSKSSSALYF
jgi:anaerobic selenocysteine-containing dehydrogenase